MDVTSDEVQNWILNKASDSDLKLLQEIISMKMRIQFRVGDTVQFDAKTRGIIHGTITKMNGKVPAVPVDNTYWGYSSVPSQDLEWWVGLPTYQK